MIKLKQFVSSGYCLKCKQCCIFEDTRWLPHLTVQDKKNLGKQKVCPKNFKNELQSCEFLNTSDHDCVIYDKRPFECSLYPFLLINNGKDLDLAAHLGCPYVLSNVNSKEFAEYCKYVEKLFADKHLIAELEKQKDVFHWYPEIELFIIKNNILENS